MNSLLDRLVVVDVADPDHLDGALRYAAGEAATRTCGVHLLVATGDLVTGDLDGARETMQRALARARVLVGERTPLTSETFHGSATHALEAAASSAELVVLQRGDHAAHAVPCRPPAWEELAAHAAAPVVIVPDLWSDGTPPGSVVTVGMDAPDRPALARAAVALAEARGARLHILHAWWSPHFRAGLRVNVERAERWRSEAAAGLADALDRAAHESGHQVRVPVRLEVRHGRPSEVLAAASRSSCLVVVGRGRAPRPGVERPLGPVTTALVRDAACPVLLVPSRSEVGAAGRTVRDSHQVRRVEAPA